MDDMSHVSSAKTENNFAFLTAQAMFFFNYTITGIYYLVLYVPTNIRRIFATIF